MGGLTHLDQFQAYEKTSRKASLRLTITKAVVDAIDANHALLPSECPPRLDCNPVRGIVRFHARAYASSAGGDFFSVGGVAYIEGHEGRWTDPGGHVGRLTPPAVGRRGLLHRR